MRILIQALPREGFTDRPRCKRIWPSDSPTAVDVIDDPTEPSKIGAGEEYWGPTIEVTRRNPHTNIEEKVSRPDPARITRSELAAIKADPLLKTMSDGETIAGLSQAALDAARKQASDLAGKLVDAESKLAGLTEELAKAKARNAELEALIAAKAAGAVGGEAGKADTAETVTHDKGSGKGKGK
jgi:hypothetical protein